jgi:endonuclease/exonuclease/phosphatase family metal-dependent hydrolase
MLCGGFTLQGQEGCTLSMANSARFAALVAALVLAGCAGISRPPQESLRLATWNLEHLAEADEMGCRPRTEADYAILRAYAAKLDADVIAFEEVETAAAAKRVFDPAKYDIVISDQPYPPFRETCGKDSAEPIRPQRNGFAIRKGIAFTVNPPVTALDVERKGGRPVRWGVDVTLEGKHALRLLGVHLKSGCSAGFKADDEDCPLLMEQVPTVKAWIDARESAGEAFAILGDFNRRLKVDDQEVWQAWNTSGDLHIAALEGDGGPRVPGCDGGRYKEFIDQVVLSGGAFTRWDKGSFGELVYDERGDAMPSDHCPIAVTIGAP